MMAFGGISVMGQSIVSFSPTGTNIPVNTELSIIFNSPIKTPLSANVIQGTIRVRNMGLPAQTGIESVDFSSGKFRVSSNNPQELIITHTFLYEANYQILGSSFSVDTDAGRASLPSSPGWTFTIENTPKGPEIDPNFQIANIQGVSLTDDLTLTFDQNIAFSDDDIYGVNIYNENGSFFSGGAIIFDEVYDLDYSGRDLIISHPPFLPGAKYYVTIDAGAIVSFDNPNLSFEGLNSTATTGWYFTTVSPPLAIVSKTPHAVDNVPTKPTLTATFNQNISWGRRGDIVINHPTNSSKSITFPVQTTPDELDIINGNTLSISGIELESETIYHITVASGAITTSSGGTFSINNNTEWWFKTEQALEGTFIPADNSPNVDLYAPLKIKFNQTVLLEDGYGYIEIRRYDNGGLFQDYEYGSPYLKFESTDGLTNNVLVIEHNPFAEGVGYYVFVSDDLIKSTSGAYYDNSPRNKDAWNFETMLIPFTPLILSPDKGEYGVPANTKILSITFNRAVEFETNGSVRVFAENGVMPILNYSFDALNPISETQLRLANDGKTLQILIDDNSSFTKGQKYFVRISRDAIRATTLPSYTFEGLGIDNIDDWSFTIETDPFEWIGTENSIWNNPNNWVGDEPSDGNEIVVIKANSPHYPVISTGVIEVGNLTIEAGALLTQTGGELNVKGLFKLESSSSLNGSFNASFIKTGGELIAPKVEVDQVMDRGAVRTYIISVPVDGVTPGNINSMVRKFNKETGANDLVGNNEILETGVGYMARSNEKLLVFKGNLNLGAHPIDVYRNEVTLGWNLVGNPYPTAVNWNLLSRSQSVENTFWMRKIAGDEIWYIYSGETKIGLGIDKPEIPSNHGIQVKVKEDETSGTITFAPAAMIPNSISYMLKSSEKTESAPVPYVKIAGVKDNTKDEMAIAFPSDASEGKDIYDVEKYFSGSSVTSILELYTNIGDMRSAINGIPYVEEMEIPLCFVVKQTGNFSIELVTNYTENATVILIDKEQGDKIINLTEIGSYSFDVATTGRNETRFILKFSGDVVDIETAHTTPINVFTGEKIIFADVPASDENQIEYKLVDISGRLVNNGYLITGTRNTIDVATAGVYMLVINNKEFSGNYKVVVK